MAFTRIVLKKFITTKGLIKSAANGVADQTAANKKIRADKNNSIARMIFLILAVLV